MIEASGSTDIARPIGDVFAYGSDARNEPKWLPGAKDVEKTTPGDVAASAPASKARTRAPAP